jgi:hypothetical protein
VLRAARRAARRRRAALRYRNHHGQEVVGTFEFDANAKVIRAAVHYSA